jgi:hypothetical protein
MNANISGSNKRTAMQLDDDQDQEFSQNKQGSKLGDPFAMDTAMDHASQQQSSKEQFIGRITKKFDEAAQSSRPITENIMPLSSELSIEKIVSIKLKKKAQQRTKVSSGVEMDDEVLGGTSTQMMSSSQSQAKKDDRSSSQSKYNFDYTSGTSSFMSGIVTVGVDDSDAIMREIMQRERTCRTRFNVLQSTGKQFDKDITAFLQSIKAREEGVDSSVLNNSLNSSQTGLLSQQTTAAAAAAAASAQKSRSLGYNRFDQERYSAKDETGGFSIDTKLTYQPNGGTISLTPNPNGPPVPSTASQPASTSLLDNLAKSQLIKPGPYFQSTQLTQQKTNIMSGMSVGNPNKTKYAPSGAPLTKRIHSNPIIIIPAARTSLIQMLNAADILQELK